MKDIKSRVKKSHILLKGVISHPLFSGSVVMIIGSNFVNFIAYIYHLILGRILGPSQYGELASVISLIGITGLIYSAISVIVVKFVSSAKSKDEIAGFWVWLNKITRVMGLVIAIGLMLISPILAKFINVSDASVLMIGPIFFFASMLTVNRSFLQGLLKFRHSVTSNILEMLVRLSISVGLVFFGLSAPGAVSGILAGVFISWVITRRFLRELKDTSTVKFTDVKKLALYSLPVVIYTAASTSVLSTDLILVKHFFVPFEAGIYAALSNLGKIVYFGSLPVTAVMFPLVASKHSKGENHRHIFLISLLLTMLISSAVLTIYLFIPETAVTILYGSQYVEASRMLVLFGFYALLFTLASQFISYYLSIGVTKPVYFGVVTALLQVAGIVMFHDSIPTVIYVNILSVSFLLVTLVLYLKYEKGQSKVKF